MNGNESDLPWEPLSVTEVAGIFSGASFPWWIAGGYAIEHAVGRAFREHEDVDVLLLKMDSALARDLLRDWDCWAADPPGTLRPWPVGEALPWRVQDVWCRRHADDPWRFQLMLDGGDRDTWRSRRNHAIAVPTDRLATRGADGIPYLRPEIQLMYKAKGRRPKDELDFEAALPVLSPAAVKWLEQALVTAYGEEHAWLTSVRRFAADVGIDLVPAAARNRL